MRLLPLAILVVIALTVFFTVRALRARRAKHELDRGWYAQQMDIGDSTHVIIARYGCRTHSEAIIDFDDPNYSEKVIEAYAQAQVKADDRNSTIRALAP